MTQRHDPGQPDNQQSDAEKPQVEQHVDHVDGQSNAGLQHEHRYQGGAGGQDTNTNAYSGTRVYGDSGDHLGYGGQPVNGAQDDPGTHGRINSGELRRHEGQARDLDDDDDQALRREPHTPIAGAQ